MPASRGCSPSCSYQSLGAAKGERHTTLVADPRALPPPPARADFSRLVERHVVLASFLTMLVGGGGNSSGQTVVETVRLLATGEIHGMQLWRLLLRELSIGAALALGLGLCAYPRVRLLSANASDLDALTISLAYATIVTMANAIGVLVAMALHRIDGLEMAAVGSPPVVQVTVDVLGVTVTMLLAQAILGEADG